MNTIYGMFPDYALPLFTTNKTPLIKMTGAAISDALVPIVNVLRAGCPSVQVYFGMDRAESLQGSDYEKKLTAYLDELRMEGETFSVITTKNTFTVSREQK